MGVFVLVSCAKRKLNFTCKAEELYNSPLFRASKEYAKKHGTNWYILSAAYGLLAPSSLIKPYEKTLLKASPIELHTWSENVYASIILCIPKGSSIQILAGERYRRYLIPLLENSGYSVSVPMKGLSIGYQLQWLLKNT